MKKIITKNNNSLVSPEYIQLLEHIKADILQTQLKATIAVTTELTLLYWRIGKEISERSKQSDWGTKVIEKLALDLKTLFPGLAGFSPRSLVYMRNFSETYDNINYAMAIAQLP